MKPYTGQFPLQPFQKFHKWDSFDFRTLEAQVFNLSKKKT